MEIREYQPSDCKELAELFYNTVHAVNAKDYTKEQLDVWATGRMDLEKWNPWRASRGWMSFISHKFKKIPHKSNEYQAVSA